VQPFTDAEWPFNVATQLPYLVFHICHGRKRRRREERKRRGGRGQTHTYTHNHTHNHTHTHTNTDTNTHTYVQTHTSDTHTYTPTHAHTHAPHARTHTHIRTHTRKRTHTQKRAHFLEKETGRKDKTHSAPAVDVQRNDADPCLLPKSSMFLHPNTQRRDGMEPLNAAQLHNSKYISFVRPFCKRDLLF